MFNSLFTEEAEEALRGKADSPQSTPLVTVQLGLKVSDVSLPQDHLMPHSVSFAAREDVHECDAK